MSNDKKTLLIAIVGPTGSGKTALAQLIEDTLQRHGIECAIQDEDTDPVTLVANKAGRITTLRQSGTKVVISQVTGEVREDAHEVTAPVLGQTPTEIAGPSADGPAPALVNQWNVNADLPKGE